jgi:hemoglobin
MIVDHGRTFKGGLMLDPEKSLYHRLGGYDAIAAFVDDLLPRLTADPQIGVYWKGKCKDSMKKDRQLVVDFLCAATGGPVNYLGRDMKTSHEGLGISESDWNIFVQHAVASLDDLGVAEREKNEFLAAAASLHGDVVEAPHASSVHA